MIEAKDTQSTTTHEANSPSAFERLRPEEPVLRLYALDHKIERGDENKAGHCDHYNLNRWQSKGNA